LVALLVFHEFKGWLKTVASWNIEMKLVAGRGIPGRDILIKRRCVRKHIPKICYFCCIPGPNRLIKQFCLAKHAVHIRNVAVFQLANEELPIKDGQLKNIWDTLLICVRLGTSVAVILRFGQFENP
jgi:hypothetical protein